MVAKGRKGKYFLLSVFVIIVLACLWLIYYSFGTAIDHYLEQIEPDSECAEHCRLLELVPARGKPANSTLPEESKCLEENHIYAERKALALADGVFHCCCRKALMDNFIYSMT